MSVKSTKKSNSLIFTVAVITLIVVAGFVFWSVKTGRLSSSAAQINPSWPETTITGHVSNTEGVALSGVTIRIVVSNGGSIVKSGLSNSNGDFSVAFGHGPQVAYNIVLQKDTYVDYKKLNVIFGQATSYPMGNIMMQRMDQAKGVIKGVVKHKNGTPMIGVNIYVTSPRGDNITEMTYEEGKYEVNKLGIGLFTVKADADDIKYNGNEQTKTVTLSLGETKPVDFTFP